MSARQQTLFFLSRYLSPVRPLDKRPAADTRTEATFISRCTQSVRRSSTDSVMAFLQNNMLHVSPRIVFSSVVCQSANQ